LFPTSIQPMNDDPRSFNWSRSQGLHSMYLTLFLSYFSQIIGFISHLYPFYQADMHIHSFLVVFVPSFDKGNHSIQRLHHPSMIHRQQSLGLWLSYSWVPVACTSPGRRISWDLIYTWNYPAKY
jgi:hypothetical protein